MAPVDLIFRDARVLSQGLETVTDVAVSGGRILRLGAAPAGGARQDVPCGGRWLLPGAIDLHVHLRDPGLTHKEDLESGTAAAVSGGVTTVCDMPNTQPPTLGLQALRDKAARAAAVARCDVRFYVGLGADNVGEIARCLSEPAFAGVKVFLGATTGDLLSGDAALEQAVDALPCLFAFHAEDETVLKASRGAAGPSPSAADHHVLRPAEAAVAGARRILALQRPGRRLHVCHLSAAAELAFVGGPGQPTGEAAPHHLFFTCEDTARQGNRLKVNPPVRTAADRDALRAALADGRILAAATDHAPHTRDEKAAPYPVAPSGVPGVETLVPAVLALVQQGALSMARAVDALSAAPARLLGLADRGAVAEGLRADLFLWDPERRWTVSAADLRTRCGWSPFEGVTLAARPDGVWVGGERRDQAFRRA